MDKSIDTIDLGMELLHLEQTQDLIFFEGKERILENLEMSNAPEKKLASFLSLFGRKDS